MPRSMVVYFGPYFIFGVRITKSYSIIAVLIGFVINYALFC